MSYACYFSDDVTLPTGSTIELTGDEGHHAAAVKRAQLGEQLIITDGLGNAKQAEVIGLAKHSLTLKLGAELTLPTPSHQFTMVQALAKGDRSLIAVESMTELGASEIIAWQAERCIVRWAGKADKGLAKWQATAKESTKQSRGHRVPKLSYLTTKELLARIASADLALIAHETATQWLSEITLPAQGSEVLVVVGPEGGISERELVQFEQAGAKVIRLADQVLRSSSAGVIALAQLQLLAKLQGC